MNKELKGDNSSKSLIIVAHPDDEILWFSSILESVSKVIICFLECLSKPRWKEGRQRSINQYPIKKVSCLGVVESEMFQCANWNDPIKTDYGLEITKEGVSDSLYRNNYHLLKELIRKSINGYRDIFTHSPWGEYGNEEHVQIYRIVKELQREFKFDIWFPAVCSNKSFKLMSEHIESFRSEYIVLKTNKMMADDIKSLYEKNDCWTWYEKWKWFEKDTYLKDSYVVESEKEYGYSFPFNFVIVKIPDELQYKRPMKKRILKKIINGLKKIRN